jgi:hypothetical protein
MNGQDPEIQAIRDAVSRYADGLHSGDIDLLRKVFHPDGMMYGASAKAVTITPIEGLFDYVAANEAPTVSGEPHECTIVDIRRSGNAALAEVAERSLYGTDYVNYLLLVKIDGEWKMVCKVFDAK